MTSGWVVSRAHLLGRCLASWPRCTPAVPPCCPSHRSAGAPRLLRWLWDPAHPPSVSISAPAVLCQLAVSATSFFITGLCLSAERYCEGPGDLRALVLRAEWLSVFCVVVCLLSGALPSCGFPGKTFFLDAVGKEPSARPDAGDPGPGCGSHAAVSQESCLQVPGDQPGQ